jgi:phosphoserine phosphatase
MNLIEAELKPFEEGETPRYRMVFFDMDGVLVDVSSWRAVFDGLGIPDEHQGLKERFKAGEFSSYVEWTDEACRVLQVHGLTADRFSEIISHLSLMRGAKEAIAELKRQGYKTAVITGSFSALAERLQRELGIDEAVAHCNLEFDEEGKLQNWRLLPCDFEGKVEALRQMVEKQGFLSSECVYIGDDANDIPIFQEVGLAIAFNCKKQEVKEAANIVVGGNDLRLIVEEIGEN